MSPSGMSECVLWIDGPKWLVEYEETSEEEFNSAQLPEECLEEMKAGDKEKWQIEASSSLLAAAETIGMAQVIKCEDYSDL